jgi:hypothetical protein
MMITALAEASAAIAEPAFLAAAVHAGEALWKLNRRAAANGDGLWRVHLNGQSSTPALQEDYANLLQGTLALFDQTQDRTWLERSQVLAEEMLQRFWDDEAGGGGFFLSEAGVDTRLITRPKSPSDGAVPSGNSVAVQALVALSRRTGDQRFADRAAATVAAFAADIERHPMGFPALLIGLSEALGGAAGPLQHAGAGAVRVAASVGDGSAPKEVEVVVELEIADGWHLNAPEPLQDELIGTRVELDSQAWSLVDLHYPDAQRAKVGTQPDEVLIYTGRQRIILRAQLSAEHPAGFVLPLRVRLQACNDTVCELPENLLIQVPLAGRRGLESVPP